MTLPPVDLTVSLPSKGRIQGQLVGVHREDAGRVALDLDIPKREQINPRAAVGATRLSSVGVDLALQDPGAVDREGPAAPHLDACGRVVRLVGPIGSVTPVRGRPHMARARGFNLALDEDITAALQVHEIRARGPFPGWSRGRWRPRPGCTPH